MFSAKIHVGTPKLTGKRASRTRDPAQTARWTDKNIDHLNDLLHEMGESLGYHFDAVTLKKNAYVPEGWIHVEMEQHSTN